MGQQHSTAILTPYLEVSKTETDELTTADILGATNSLRPADGSFTT